MHEVELHLTPRQIDLLFPALKTAEIAYTTQGNFQACKELTKVYATLHKQVFTYGQIGEDDE